MTNLERWRHYLKDLESPDLFIDWGFYFLISTAMQRRVWIYPDGFTLYPNLFIILIGPPAAGKTRVISQIANIIKSGKLTYIDKSDPKKPESKPLFPYSADTITQEALIEYIARHCSRIFDYKDKNGKTRKMSANPIAFMVEELGVLFRKNTEDMVNMLNQFYDAGSYTYKTKKCGTDAIQKVCFSMIAGTTPSFIKEAFNEKIISQGFTSRVIMIYGAKPRFLRQFPGLTEDQVEAKIELINHIKKISRVAGEMQLSGEAKEYHRHLYEDGEITEKRINQDYRLDNYYGRKNVHLLKMAMLFHFADSTDLVLTKEDIKKAYQFLATTEIRMQESFDVVGRNELGEISKLIHSYIANSGESGVKFKKLWLKFVSEVNKQELESCLEFLLTTEQVYVSGNHYKATGNNLP